jgi:hypothetical protein
MSGELYNCNHCEYTSNKKYNLYRHMVSKHINCNVDISNSINTNVNIDDTNVNINNTNVNMDDTNVNTDNKCTKCNKILSSKSYLNKHLLICKGVSNPLECYICHRVFSHRASKSYHIKKCKEKQFAIVPVETKNTEIVSVVDSQNNELVLNQSPPPPQAQQIITNNISGDMINNIYNINLISYNKEDEKIEFDISHLKLNELEHKIRVRCPDSSFKLFCDKLFENKNNQMIIKSNLRNKYSNIHLGMNIWEKILDNYIYPILMSHIAEKMIVFFNINSRKMKELDDYLQIMASQGYSNSNTTGYRIKYRRNIEQLKLLFNTFN